MTSLKQIGANRRNAQKSTGPSSPEGKERSRCNAVRHGLTAETVIGMLESAEDYENFQTAIMADYEASSVVERELISRLASLLWRLRRATTIETGLFEMQADPLASFRQHMKFVHSLRSANAVDKSVTFERGPDLRCNTAGAGVLGSPSPSHNEFGNRPDLTQCFLRLANLPNFAFDRVSRYEMSLWRQADQILNALGDSNRSKFNRKAFGRRE
jgi:hypothetical protein